MPRNITAVQKRALDFHKSDVLAETNQIKHDCFFFLHSAGNIKKLFSHDLKLETKIQDTFLDFILFLNIAVK